MISRFVVSGTSRRARSSHRRQLDRGVARPLPAEVARVLGGSRRVVLGEVGFADPVLQRLAASMYGADRDQPRPNLDGTRGIVDKGPIPAPRLEAPRSHEDAPIDDDGPDADETML